MISRLATPHDYPAIATIYNHYVGKATMDMETRDVAYFSHLASNMGKREKMYVVEVGGNIIAYGIIKKYSFKEGYKHACETSVFILPAYTNKGYGSQFKQFIIDECKKLNYKHLVAKIFRSNKVSIDYNLKIGYTIVGVQQKIGRLNGKWLDVVIMQYIIE